MAQHDYDIANALNPAVRGDINSCNQAVVTRNSGSVAPGVTYPFMEWIDTSTIPATYRYRNSGNTAWVVAGQMDTANYGMVSANNAALTGISTTPTPAIGNNSTQIANTAYVRSEIGNHGTWLIPTLGPGWTAAGAVGLAYRVRRDRMVEFRGQATKNNPISGDVVFTIPAGNFANTTIKPFLVNAVTAPALISFDVGGTVSYFGGPLTGGQFVFFDGVLVPGV